LLHRETHLLRELTEVVIIARHRTLEDAHQPAVVLRLLWHWYQGRLDHLLKFSDDLLPRITVLCLHPILHLLSDMHLPLLLHHLLLEPLNLRL